MSGGNCSISFELETIVLGNGSSMIGSAMGSVIDRFGTIVRINNFATAGFENYVGSRTDIWVHNAGPLIRSRELGGFKQIVGCTPLFDRFSDSCQQYIPRDCIDEVRERFRRFEGSRFPSTGLFVIAYMLTKCKRVFIHGFDHFAPGVHHYFESGGDPTPHSSAAERQFAEIWIRVGKVVRLPEYLAGTTTELQNQIA